MYALTVTVRSDIPALMPARPSPPGAVRPPSPAAGSRGAAPNRCSPWEAVAPPHRRTPPAARDWRPSLQAKGHPPLPYLDRGTRLYRRPDERIMRVAAV